MHVLRVKRLISAEAGSYQAQLAVDMSIAQIDRAAEPDIAQMQPSDSDV